MEFRDIYVFIFVICVVPHSNTIITTTEGNNEKTSVKLSQHVTKHLFLLIRSISFIRLKNYDKEVRLCIIVPVASGIIKKIKKSNVPNHCATYMLCFFNETNE